MISKASAKLDPLVTSSQILRIGALDKERMGARGGTGELFSYVDLEDRVPAQHPLRAIRSIVNEVLAALDGESFEALWRHRPKLDPARATAASAAAAGVLHDPLGAAADGATRLRWAGSG
jgi:hypothetical protein